MKINKLSIFLALVVFGLLTSGCRKFIDVNDNPNQPTFTNSAFVMTGAIGTTYRNQVSTNVTGVPGTWVGHYAHSTSFTGGGNEKTYDFTPLDFEAWSSLYDNMADYQYVKEHADADGVGFWKAPADIMQCYVWQQLVDLYGNVPYKQVFQGTKNITPAYDKDSAIYADLIVRLDSSMANIANTNWPITAEFTTQDILFQGNKTNWIRFANTLKLRILMRQSFMPGRASYITNNINNTLSRGYLSNAPTNVMVQAGYQNIAGKLNPFFSNYGYDVNNTPTTNYRFRKMNAVIINFLKNTQDTLRLTALAYPQGTAPTVSAIPPFTFADYRGVPLGANASYSTATSSPMGPLVIAQNLGTRPGIMMTLAEAYFLQAEAAHLFGIAFPGGTAKDLYEAGIRAHFRLCADPTSVTGTSAVAQTGDAYAIRYYSRSYTIPGSGFGYTVNPTDINWNLAADKERAILIQKWVSLCHVNGLEAWSEYRKSSGSPSVGVPYSVLSISANHTEPVRYYYPQTEYNTNASNVPATSTYNVYTSRIFWDVN